jgi:hypothetical protein
MTDTVHCVECDREIGAADAFWFRPYASDTDDSNSALVLQPSISHSEDARGLPFHAACLERRLNPEH